MGYSVSCRQDTRFLTSDIHDTFSILLLHLELPESVSSCQSDLVSVDRSGSGHITAMADPTLRSALV